MLERRCALTQGETGPPLKMGEVRGFALLQAVAFIDTVEALEHAVRSVIGVDLPKRVGVPASSHDHRAFKVGPEHFWIVGPEETSIASLREAVCPQIGSITPLSHGRTRLFIEGASAREVLAKGIALDLHPEVFPVEACALTELQHTPVLLHRIGQDRYELYALRTYAVWIWEWLIDAALPLRVAAGA